MSRPARALLLLALAAACARAPESGAPDSPAPVAAADPCVVAGTPGRSADTLDVILDPPPSQSPIPQSGSDWFISAHAVETLVRLDCTGIARPALAASWERQAGGRVWTFRLRDDATFWDGTPLLADSIVPQWRLRSGQWARLALAGVTSIEVDGQRGIRVAFAEPTDSAPALLADPGLAPFLERGGSGALGAGSWRPNPAGPLTSLAPTLGGPVLRIVTPSRDLRDALDGGADFVVTADPATLAYARSRPALATLPLPWARTYLLLSPEPFGPAAEDGFRTALARDVVREDARAATPPFWWDAPCVPGSTTSGSRRSGDTHLLYPADDAVAAALAARMVALGAVGPRGVVRPVPLPELLARLDNGRLAGAILGLPRLAPIPCSPRPRSLAGWSVMPLVDTRAHIIARRDGPALQVDGFGAVRLVAVEAPQP